MHSNINTHLLDPVEVDPLALEESLIDRIGRYLLTALPISNRFPELRKQAKEQLEAGDAILKGPFLEALPDYRKGKSLQYLVEQEKLLHSGFAKLKDGPSSEACVYRRPLHEHQEEAIRAVVKRNENIVVATGTGSGKTESFFFPMLECLLREDLKERSGIRAIIIYPMNALANDQIEQRLVPVFAKQLAEYGITVGQYTGKTERDDRKKEVENLLSHGGVGRKIFGDDAESIPDNWLLTREEMKTSPPHVLVTNYAMLEHLLLLPDNRQLFNNCDLKFLVLDEIHMYSGSQAGEVALLLRKLRGQHGKGNKIRCIGTSASLGEGEDAAKAVKSFAERLFGEKFEIPINSPREPHNALSDGEPIESISVSDWLSLRKVMLESKQQATPQDQHDHWNENVAPEYRIPDDTTLSRHLITILGVQRVVREVSENLISNKATLFSELAKQLFPDESNGMADRALRAVVSLGAFARLSKNSYPLLPARYHYFTRGVENATVRLASPSDTSEHATDFRFASVYIDEEGNRRYKLLTCRKCGELYFEAFRREGAQQVLSSVRLPGQTRVAFWLKKKDDAMPLESEEEEGVWEDHQPVFVHLREGTCRDNLDDADKQSGDWLETFEAKMKMPESEEQDTDPDAQPMLVKCYSCGAQDCNEIITPFTPGDQALSTTISEVLYAHLPTDKESKNSENPKPGRGRNLLVFSDNRQDAAFFHPYFQRTHEDLVVRQNIAKILRDEESEIPLKILSTYLSEAPLRGGVTTASGEPASDDNIEEVLKGFVYREFCTPGGRKFSLEELGIVEVVYPRIDFEDLAQKMKLPADANPNLIRWFLDALRRDRIIKLPGGLKPTDEFVWSSLYNQANRKLALTKPQKKHKEVCLWFQPQLRTPPSKPYENRFTDALTTKNGISHDRGFRKIWNILEEKEILVQGGNVAAYKVLNTDKISVRLRESDAVFWQCKRCGRLSQYNLGDNCVAWRCKGKMEHLSPSTWRDQMTDNHYHHLYTNLTTASFPTAIVREHTASIGDSVRSDIENRFKSGEINILSSSTTMEVGIDLGDLEGVFLRNVPPEISNYQQRAGRAGRRAQAAPVAITYARNRNYDRQQYENAGEFLRSDPSPPFCHLGNKRLFERHLFSIILSDYLSSQSGRIEGRVSIGQLFGLPGLNGKLDPDEGADESFSEARESEFLISLRTWLTEAEETKIKAKNLFEMLESFLSDEEKRILRDSLDRLEEIFLEKVCTVVSDFSSKYRHYYKESEEFSHKNKHGQAARYQKHFRRLSHSHIVSYLSKHGLIPTYSFPAHSIDLTILDGNWHGNSSIDLTRDAKMGIVEYAPGAKVVSNGRKWTSVGIAHRPIDFNPTRSYKLCGECGHIETAEEKANVPEICRCGEKLPRVRHFIEPVEFISPENSEEVGFRRAYNKPAIETKLVTSAPESRYSGTDLHFVSWADQRADEGRLVVINQGKGRGYRRCSCGYAYPISDFRESEENANGHQNPYKEEACNRDWWYPACDLAHTFHTDVVQIRVPLQIDDPVNEANEPFTGKKLKEARNGIARTISEAIRQSCCSVFPIPERELDVTSRWYRGGLEIVLFDSISGGAGHALQIISSNSSAKKLFKTAAGILDCDCETSCARCLRTYSNQRYWDKFRREEARDWIDKITRFPSKPMEEHGGKKISKDRLGALLDSASEIILFAGSLGEFGQKLESDPDTNFEKPISDYFPEIKKIVNWCNNDKIVHLASTELPDFQDFALPLARRTAEQLRSWVRPGTLSIRTRKSANLEDIFALIKPKGTGDPVEIILLGGDGTRTNTCTLEAVIPKEPGIILEKQITSEEFESAKSGLDTPIPIEKLEDSARIRQISYECGDRRNIHDDFSFINAAPLVTIALRDRYIFAADWQLNYLKKFFEKIEPLIHLPENNNHRKPVIKVHFGPTAKPSDRSNWDVNKNDFHQWLSSHDLYRQFLFIPQLHTGNKLDYHDRQIEFTQYANASSESPSKRGPKKKGTANEIDFRYPTTTAELTGGIANLMNEQQKTTVYIFGR